MRGFKGLFSATEDVMYQERFELRIRSKEFLKGFDFLALEIMNPVSLKADDICVVTASIDAFLYLKNDVCRSQHLARSADAREESIHQDSRVCCSDADRTAI